MGSFEDIDARRAAAGITRKALYERAGVNKETWRRTAQRRTSPNTATVRKLEEALAALVSEREPA